MNLKTKKKSQGVLRAEKLNRFISRSVNLETNKNGGKSVVGGLDKIFFVRAEPSI